MSKSKDFRTLDRLISDKRKEWGADERDRRKAVYGDILEGFRDLQEAKEYVEGMEDDRVIYTARGNEISFSLLRIIIKHIEGNPWYSPWGHIEKPRAIPMTSTTGREGLCFQLAFQHVTDQEEGTLVHGKVWSPKLRRMIDHAWVITETGYIYEPVSDRYFEMKSLYETYKMREINTYSPTEARKMALRAKNYGPWTDEDRRKALSGVAPQTEDKLFGRYHRPLPKEAY